MLEESENRSLYSETTFNMKKKWYEESLFNNQAKRKEKKIVLNDKLRSRELRDFLKEFVTH